MKLSTVVVFCSLLFLCTTGSSAQEPRPSGRELPDRDYFQQHVYYLLDATMKDDPSTPHLEGQGSLFYRNNSPDTLREVYFHLYWNLFKSGSYGEHAPNRDHSENDTYESEGVTIKSFGQQLSSGTEDDTKQIEIDNTILHLKLKTPIPPGAERTFTFAWIGQMPNYEIRSTWGYHDHGQRNFSTAQWYPQICVYDEHGWHPDQYIGMGEFYTDYGMFDVTLHLPSAFTTVVSTGYQTNPEILSDEVRAQLAIAREHPDSLVRIADHGNEPFHANPSRMVTWKFHADSVRDFAWCADDGYIWDAIYKNGTMHNALYWENSRTFWSREAARIATHTVQFDSKLAGQYLYPNLFMCETYEGGMEYPGIVFIGPYTGLAKERYAQNTMMHEIGHEWYPMMMGSNETDYGYMDEGFNTFITTLAQEDYYGRYNNAYEPGLGYNDDERSSNYRWSWGLAMSGQAEPPETKADMFDSYRSYAEATYGKTQNIFFMLRYTMGDSAFGHFLHAYYERWHMRHPYPDDLRRVAETIDLKDGDTSRVRARGDLRWFFDEWFRKSWTLDYKLAGFSTTGNEATVTIARLGRCVMPIDLVFTFADGTTERRWIAVDDWLRTVADERMYHYTFTSKPLSVAINPTNELFDINRLNNSSSWLPPIEVSLVPKVLGDVKPIDAYAIRSAPFWVGTTYGWTFLGSFLERNDRIALGLRATVPGNGLAVQPGLVLQYHAIEDALSPNTHLDLALVHAMDHNFAGFQLAQIAQSAGSEAPIHTFELGYDWSQWSSSSVPLNRVELGYSLQSKWELNRFVFAADLENGVGDPRTSYTKLALTSSLRLDLGAEWNVLLRVFGGSIQPVSGLGEPEQSQFRLAAASQLQEFADIFTSNFGSPEGNKLRNPAASGPLVRGYLLDHDPLGRVAGSATFEIGNSTLTPFGWLRGLPVLGNIFECTGFTLFADGGFVGDRFTAQSLDKMMVYDFGPGLRLNGPFTYYIKRAFDIDLLRTELQIDFPIYLSNPVSDPKYKFRWQIFLRQNF